MTVKLALIRQKYRPDGGAERFISRALDGLGNKDLEVTVITRKWPEQAGNFKILTCNPVKWGRISRERGFANQVCDLLTQHSFDLVQSHERLECCDIYRAGDGVHREWLIQRKRILSPFKQRLLDASLYHRYVCRAEKQMFESPHLKSVICNSHMVKEEILHHFNIAPEKLCVIYNGIDTDFFSPASRTEFRQQQRKALDIPENELTGIFVGSGFERKGLASALKAIAKSPTAFRLLVVGNDKNLQYYQNLADNLGIASRVHWLGVQKDVRPFYAAADLLLLPTLYDPFPNVIFEAMACGLPVITSTKCGGAELIQEGINGAARDALDIAGLASALAEFGSLERCIESGNRARETVIPLHQQNMINQLAALYESLLGKGEK